MRELFGQDGVRATIAPEPFSADGSRLLVTANDREPTDEDIIVVGLDGHEGGRPLADGKLNSPVAFSPNGSKILYADVRSNTDSDVGVVDIASGTSTILTKHEGEVLNTPADWAPDGSGFYLVTNRDAEFLGLVFVDATTGEEIPLWTGEWDVEQVTTADHGRYLAVAVNEDGFSRLHIHDLGTDARPGTGPNPSGQRITLPDIPQGVISELAGAADAPVFCFLLSEPTRAPEVYSLDLEAGRVTRLTDSMLGGIDPATLIAPELIRYPTHDGREIPAWLYRPKGAGLFPVVLSIHGGPEWQERASYGSGMYQYLLSQGIGIMAPNVRGSTGYGKSYKKLIHRDWGGDELRDFQAAAEYLKGLDWVDGDRLGVYGGSFGGFATLSCVSRLPDYWAVAVDIVGPSNLVTFARAVPPTWRRMMTEWVGDPETEAEFLMERSPITYVDQIRAPLFVIQGANDPRVVKPESDQIVERLRSRGVDVRYDVYDDEGHGFTKRANELRAMGDACQFLVEHLKEAASAR